MYIKSDLSMLIFCMPRAAESIKIPKSYNIHAHNFTLLRKSCYIHRNHLFITGLVDGKMVKIMHHVKLRHMFLSKTIHQMYGAMKDGIYIYPKIGFYIKIPTDISKYPLILQKDLDNISNGSNIKEIQQSWNNLLHYEIAVYRHLLQKKPAYIKPQYPIHHLKCPFTMSEEQLYAWKNIQKDLLRDHTTRRLVYGEVGSGKSILIFMAAQHTYYNNRTVLILSPSKLLAEQLFEKFSQWNPDLELQLVTEQTPVINKLSIIIGTQSLFFRDLPDSDLLIIDEQHKFGIKQREKLENKCHVITLTATPIPKTLAHIMRGSVEISYLTQRYGTINTYVVSMENRDKLLKKLLERSKEKLILWILNNIENAEKFYKSLPEDINKKLIHSKIDNKNNILKDLSVSSGLIVSTTVIEVGVDCDFSTVVIENAESFGLAQLHQIRGRVGRKQGSVGNCILLGRNEEKLRQIQQARNCYEISQLDLINRGGGSIGSLKQHGESYIFAKAIVDYKVINRSITDKDIELSENITLSPEIIDFFSES